MGLFDFFKKKDIESNNKDYVSQPKAHYRNNSGGTTFRNLYSESFDGEKNFGAIGPLVEYQMDYGALRTRSWKSYIDSEIAQTVINKYRKWVIGSGLKLQSLPNTTVIGQEGAEIDKDDFTKTVESRWKVYSNSKIPCMNGEKTLHQITNDAFINKIIAGDVLIVLRVKNGTVKVELIDADYLVTSNLFVKVPKGHDVVNGVEYNNKGRVVAYHVMGSDSMTEAQRIKAYNSGFRVAYLYKGLTYKLNSTRGIPLISAVMETLVKLERYKEATVASAEEVAKIAYQVVHQSYSSGENPMQDQLAKAFDVESDGANIPVDELGNELADKVAATTGNQAYNNPVGAEIKAMQTGNKELYFKDFYTVNIDLVCATLGIPPEIAMSLYRSNFSASRAALKDWEHTLFVDRDDVKEQFLQPIYELWLYVETIKKKIKAPDLIDAVFQKNEMLFQSFTESRFVGATVPHIDPLKEVKAERAKLGDKGGSLPLSTLEQSTELLNGGESDTNMENYAKEYKEAIRLGLISESPENEEEEEEGED